MNLEQERVVETGDQPIKKKAWYCRIRIWLCILLGFFVLAVLTVGLLSKLKESLPDFETILPKQGALLSVDFSGQDYELELKQIYLSISRYMESQNLSPTRKRLFERQLKDLEANDFLLSAAVKTSPWRLAMWQEGEEFLVCVAFSRGAGITRWIFPRRERVSNDQEDRLCTLWDGNLLIFGNRKNSFEKVLQELKTCEYSHVEGLARVFMRASANASQSWQDSASSKTENSSKLILLDQLISLMIPGGASSCKIDLKLARNAQDSVHLSYELQAAEIPDSPWGLEKLHSLLEREGLRLNRLNEAGTITEGTSGMQGHWEVTNFEEVFDSLQEQLEFWLEDY